jgi:hypothetical protein
VVLTPECMWWVTGRRRRRGGGGGWSWGAAWVPGVVAAADPGQVVRAAAGARRLPPLPLL